MIYLHMTSFIKEAPFPKLFHPQLWLDHLVVRIFDSLFPRHRRLAVGLLTQLPSRFASSPALTQNQIWHRLTEYQLLPLRINVAMHQRNSNQEQNAKGHQKSQQRSRPIPQKVRHHQKHGLKSGQTTQASTAQDIFYLTGRQEYFLMILLKQFWNQQEPVSITSSEVGLTAKTCPKSEA